MNTAPSGVRRWLRGIGAMVTTASLLAGVPYLLIMLTAGLLRGPLPSWDQVGRILGQPSTDPTWLVVALVVAGWLSWAVFTASFIAELIAAVRGTTRKALPALSPRGAARSLIAGIALLVPIAMPSASFALQPEAVISQVVAASPSGAAPGAARVTVEEPAATREAATAPETTRDTGRRKYQRYVVGKGDSLWGIAETELDDGQRFPEIYRASRELRQPGGKRLTDPSHIEPGWRLRIPADEPGSRAGKEASSEPDPTRTNPTDGSAGTAGAVTKAQARSDRSDRSDASNSNREQDGTIQKPELNPLARERAGIRFDEQESTAPGTDSVAPESEDSGSSAPQTTNTETDSQDSRVLEETAATEAPWPIRTAGGIGSLLAAGLLAGLAGRRLRQRRRRRPGQLLPLVPDQELDQEASLGVISDPLSMCQVDAALRTMAQYFRDNQSALPTIRHARLSQHQFELFLAEPASLPAPWSGTSDSLIWTLDVFDAAAAVAEASGIAAPYPALVTIGHLTVRGHESHLLLDLDHVAALGVRGDPEVVNQIVRALSLELATSIWADDLQLTAIGMLADFEAATGTGRVQHVDSPQPTLSRLEQRHRRYPQDGESGVVDPVEPRVPEILVTGDTLSAPDRELLGGCLAGQPRSPLSAITGHDALGDWYLEQDPTDDRSATLHPLGLRIEPQRVTEDTYRQILATFSRAAAPATATGAEAAATPEPKLATLPDGPDERVGPAADLSTQVGPSDPGRPGRQSDAGTAEPPPRAPVIKVLGQPEVAGAVGPIEETKRSRCLEIAAYLSLFPDHTATDFSQALWPGSDPADGQGPRSALVSRTRRWLGVDESGEYWLGQDAASGYRLREEVTSDWGQLQRLLPEGPFPATDDDLAAALQLIRGRPFDGVPARRYGWATGLQEQMLPLLTDICYESAARLLGSGHWHAAAEAAERGLAVDRLYEPIWRILILAELRENGAASASARGQELQDLLDRYDLDMETPTVDLLAEIQASVPGNELDAPASM